MAHPFHIHFRLSFCVAFFVVTPQFVTVLHGVLKLVHLSDGDER